MAADSSTAMTDDAVSWAELIMHNGVQGPRKNEASSAYEIARMTRTAIGMLAA